MDKDLKTNKQAKKNKKTLIYFGQLTSWCYPRYDGNHKKSLQLECIADDMIQTTN